MDTLFMERTAAAAEKLTAIRRDFHKHAETGWMEMRTASLIARRLTDLGYEVLVGSEVCKDDARMGVPDEATLQMGYERAKAQGADPEFLEKVKGGFTGVIGILRAGEGPVYGMRFDIDALGVFESKEETHRPAKEGFASVNEGSMHACGHDGHAAIGLGVAEVLMQYKEEVHGTVKLIFQPAEEGVRGAKSIVAAGHLDDVDILLGSHVTDSRAAKGEDADIIPGAGGSLATTKLDAIFHGQAAHAGGVPERGVNAMLAMATAVLNLQAIPRHSGGATRINVGRVVAGSGRNVIPDIATMELEIRGQTTELNEYMENYARRVLQSAADMHGCTVEIKLMGATGSLESSEPLMYALQEAAPASGLRSTSFVYSTSGGSEDFAYMMNCVQGHGGQATFIRVLGETAGPGHSRTFDFDESILLKGVRAFAGYVLYGKRNF